MQILCRILFGLPVAECGPSICFAKINLVPIHSAGRRIVCHDDRYILKTAVQKQAVIVSNDEYRDLVHENPEWRAVVDHLLLIYTFVDGKSVWIAFWHQTGKIAQVHATR